MAVDRRLVERAQGGDRAAYEALARESADRLFGVCRRILRDPDQAEDALQRTLVAIWTDIRGLRDPDRFEAWSYRLAVRFSVREATRPGRLGGNVRPLSLDPPAPRDSIREAEERATLEAAFRILSAEQRAVVVLRYYVGLPLDEIAAVAGVPIGTVSSRLHYALARLRSEVAPERAVRSQGVPA